MSSHVFKNEALEEGEASPNVSVSSADREALKLMMAELVDISIPITTKESFMHSFKLS